MVENIQYIIINRLSIKQDYKGIQLNRTKVYWMFIWKKNLSMLSDPILLPSLKIIMIKVISTLFLSLLCNEWKNFLTRVVFMITWKWVRKRWKLNREKLNLGEKSQKRMQSCSWGELCHEVIMKWNVLWLLHTCFINLIGTRTVC